MEERNLYKISYNLYKGYSPTLGQGQSHKVLSHIVIVASF